MQLMRRKPTRRSWKLKAVVVYQKETLTLKPKKVF
jgi:hypothetical protein